MDNSNPSTTQHSSDAVEPIQIEGIEQPVILDYFTTLNKGDFQATALLFAVNGALHPPLETPVVGREAIAAYLVSEASGIYLLPQRGELINELDHLQSYKIMGKVRMPLFTVNVSWQIALNQQFEIASVTIKLLESLEKLAKFRTKFS